MSTFAPTEALQKLLYNRVIDARLGKAVTLDSMASKGQVRTADQTNLDWDVVVSSGGGAWSAFTASGAEQATGQTVLGSLSIGSYKVHHTFSVNSINLANAAKQGVGSLKRVLQKHIDDGLLILRRKINEAIWLGDGTSTYGGMVGLGKVLDNTVSYANIDPATWTAWTATTLTNGSNRALTKDLLLDFKALLTTKETDFDAVLCSPNTAKTYNKLFDTTAGNLSIANGAGGVNGVDLMGQGMRFIQGIPIIEDPMCPDGRIVTLFTPEVELLSFDLEGADGGILSRLGFVNNLAPIKSAEVNGLRVNIAMLPGDVPGVLKFQMFCVPQLRCFNRKMVGGILNLTT